VLEHDEAGSDLFVALQAVMADENVRDLVLHLAGRTEKLDDATSARLRELLGYLGKDSAFSTLCLALIHRPQIPERQTGVTNLALDD